MLSERSQTQDYILSDSIYMTFWKQQNSRDRKQLRGGGDYKGLTRGNSGGR